MAEQKTFIAVSLFSLSAPPMLDPYRQLPPKRGRPRKKRRNAIKSIRTILRKASQPLTVREIAQRRISGGYTAADRKVRAEIKSVNKAIFMHVRSCKVKNQRQLLFRWPDNRVSLSFPYSIPTPPPIMDPNNQGGQPPKLERPLLKVGLSVLESVQEILREASQPLTVKEIAQKRINEGLTAVDRTLKEEVSLVNATIFSHVKTCTAKNLPQGIFRCPDRKISLVAPYSIPMPSRNSISEPSTNSISASSPNLISMPSSNSISAPSPNFISASSPTMNPINQGLLQLIKENAHVEKAQEQDGKLIIWCKIALPFGKPEAYEIVSCKREI